MNFANLGWRVKNRAKCKCFLVIKKNLPIKKLSLMGRAF